MHTGGIFSRWGCSRTVWTICSWIVFLLFFTALTAAQEPTTGSTTGDTPTAISPTVDTPTVESPAAGSPTADKTTTGQTSWFGFLRKGGLTMIPITLCSIGFIAIVAAKFPIFRLMRFGINRFAQSLTEDVAAGQIEHAIVMCERYNNPITRPLQKGLTVYQKDPARTGDTLREAMLDEIPGLESYIGWLGIIAGVAPLLGLYGTVVGVINAFIELASGGAVTDPASFTRLADGIYKALITTAAGLFVGMPAFVTYEYFRMRIGDLMRDMDRVSVSLLNALGIGTGGQL